jgi:hypothetical protein
VPPFSCSQPLRHDRPAVVTLDPAGTTLERIEP